MYYFGNVLLPTLEAKMLWERYTKHGKLKNAALCGPITNQTAYTAGSSG